MGTAVAERAATAVKPMTILAVASGIRMHIDNAARADASATEHWIKAGQLLLHARERIESAKEGNAIDWGGWCERHAGYSQKHCERLMRWASAEDPWKAIEDHRERTRLAVAKHREKKAAELTVSSKPNEPDAAATAEGKTPKPKPKPNPNPEPDDVAAVDADDGGAVKRKRRTSAEVEAERIADACSIVETTWDMSSPEVQQHLLHHILRESDPVSLALALVETMDADQVRRLMVGVEEHRAQLGRKRASQKPADGRSNVAVDDPAPENEGDDDLGDIPACLDRRQ